MLPLSLKFNVEFMQFLLFVFSDIFTAGMVYFTCDACGEQLKKPSVEKHYTQKCRDCYKLTCIDCLKVVRSFLTPLSGFTSSFPCVSRTFTVMSTRPTPLVCPRTRGTARKVGAVGIPARARLVILTSRRWRWWT